MFSMFDDLFKTTVNFIVLRVHKFGEFEYKTEEVRSRSIEMPWDKGLVSLVISKLISDDIESRIKEQHGEYPNVKNRLRENEMLREYKEVYRSITSVSVELQFNISLTRNFKTPAIEEIFEYKVEILTNNIDSIKMDDTKLLDIKLFKDNKGVEVSDNNQRIKQLLHSSEEHSDEETSSALKSFFEVCDDEVYAEMNQEIGDTSAEELQALEEFLECDEQHPLDVNLAKAMLSLKKYGGVLSEKEVDNLCKLLEEGEDPEDTIDDFEDEEYSLAEFFE